MNQRHKVLILTEKLGRWGICAVFLFAAIPKIIHPLDFAEVIAAYGLLPEPFVVPLAYILPPLEVVAAVALFRQKRWGYIGIGGLLLFFILVLAYGIHLGLDVDCGCFGPEDPEHKAFSGLRTAVVRDFLLLILLSYSFWYSNRRARLTY